IEMLKERSSFSEKDISEINLNPDTGMTLFTYNSALPVKLGFDFSDDRFERLEMVFSELKKRSFMPEYIDLGYDNKVVVKVASNIE
ncbi:cell division protein FtsQ/DivIB, partial [Thermodesulfobacteriota bacterium]